MLRKLLRWRTKTPEPHSREADAVQAAEAIASWIGAVHAADVSTMELRAAFPKTKPPTHAVMKRFAEKHGVKTREILETDALLVALAKHPVFVHWYDPELRRQQYTVFYTVERDMLFLLDPHWGKRRVPKEIFDRNWKRVNQKKPWALEPIN